MVQSAAWPPLLCVLNLAALATLKDGAVGGAAPLGRGCKGVTQWHPHHYQSNSPLRLTSPGTLGSSVHAAHLASLPSVVPDEGDN